MRLEEASSYISIVAKLKDSANIKEKIDLILEKLAEININSF